MSTIINRDLSYILTTDCQVRFSDGKAEMIRGDRLLEMEEEYLVDTRLRLVSFDTKKNLDTYFKYYSLFSRLSDIESSRPENIGRYVAYLDMGYVPVIAPPSFMSEEVVSLLKPLLERSGVELKEFKAMRLSGTEYPTTKPDIWASRMSIAEYLGCDIGQVKPLNFIKEVVRR